MSSRPLIIASLVGASVGVPYFASHASKDGKGIGSLWPAAASAPQPAGTAPGLPAVGNAAAPATTPNAIDPKLLSNPASNGTQFQSVDQVLRFDVNKEWVYLNWPRKSTGPTDVGLVSVRVPLVMRPGPSSMTGSLTYFFNAQNAVEHISFHGRTADTAQLVQFLSRYYQLQAVQSPVGEQWYQAGDDNGIRSELRARTEGVVSAGTQNGVAVDLELARPGSPRYLPPRPTGLQIPPVAASAPPPGAGQAATAAATSSDGSWSSSMKSAMGSYFDQARYATPGEEGQVLWKRWPN